MNKPAPIQVEGFRTQGVMGGNTRITLLGKNGEVLLDVEVTPCILDLLLALWTDALLNATTNLT